MKEFCVKFHLADSEYMTALRLAAGAVCSAHDMDIDLSEDFKVCVTESALILKDSGFDAVTVTFADNDKLVCTVEGSGGSPRANENEFSLALISALVSDCEIARRGEVIERVILKV